MRFSSEHARTLVVLASGALSICACTSDRAGDAVATGLTRVPGPTKPTRYIWRPAARETPASLEWIRVKLSPGSSSAGYHYVLGICAKQRLQPRPFCGGGACDARSCPIKGGAAFAYSFLGRPRPKNSPTPATAPLMEIRWRGRLKLRRPGPGQETIELSAYDFRKGIRLREEQ